ncbi:MAG TPA: DUF2007 domain-containing protein, partial [Acidobacteriota bacterium]|nr:DUF2007 domain-containing protein [Acidobacteriota bacterium]
MAHATDRPIVGYVTVATIHDRQEARAITAKLEAAAIDCLLVDERGMASLALGKLGLGEIKVQVNRRDVSRALQILRADANKPSIILAPVDSARRLQRVFGRLTGWKLT